MPGFEEWARSVSATVRRCRVCALPEEIRTEVEKARGAGYGVIRISQYLAALGHVVTRSSIENHFQKGHR